MPVWKRQHEPIVTGSTLDLSGAGALSALRASIRAVRTETRSRLLVRYLNCEGVCAIAATISYLHPCVLLAPSFSGRYLINGSMRLILRSGIGPNLTALSIAAATIAEERTY